MGLISYPNQVGADQHAVACPPQAAFQKVGHAQFATDLIGALLRVLVLHGRGPGDYAKPLRMQTAELCDHLLRQAVAEVFLLPIAGEVFFFSSRRRHTSLTCDWSSDVCSSD